MGILEVMTMASHNETLFVPDLAANLITPGQVLRPPVPGRSTS